MPDLDGNIIDELQIRINVDNSNAKRKLDEVATAIKKIGTSSTGSGLKNAGDRLETLEKAINGIDENNTAKLKKLADTLGNLKDNSTSGVQKVSKSLDTLQNSLDKINFAKLDWFINRMKALKDAVGDEFNVSVKINDSVKASSGRSGTSGGGLGGDDTTLNPGTSGAVNDVENTSRGMERFHKITDGLASVLNNVVGRFKTLTTYGLRFTSVVGKGVLSLVSKPFRMLGSALSNIGKRVSNFITMFKKRALYRLINSIISLITNGFKEGIQNLYRFSQLINGDFAKSMDSIATSMLYLKNSLGALVSPIINALAPVVDKLVDRVVDGLNAINRAVAYLTGASTWTRALKYPITYADSLGTATKKAKELKATILGIDELNLMNGQNNTSSGSGYSDEDYLKMFKVEKLDKTSAFPKMFDGILDVAKNIKSTLDEVWNSAYMVRFKNSVSNLFGNIKTFTGGILDDFNSIWKSGDGKTLLTGFLSMCSQISDVVGNILGGFGEIWSENASNGKGIMTTISRIVGNIFWMISNLASRFNDAWNAVDGKEKLLKPIDNLISEILGFVEDITIEFVKWTETVDFEPLIKSVGNLVDKVKDFVVIAKGSFKTAWDTIIKPALTYLTNAALPDAINILASSIETLNGALNLFNGDVPFLERLENFGKGIVDTISSVINAVGHLAANPVMRVILRFIAGNAVDLLPKEWQDIDLWADFHWDEAAAGVTGNSNYISEKTLQERYKLLDDWSKYQNQRQGILWKAAGGMVDQGTAFIAGERGAEIVGNVGSKTGVMNVGQLSAGVAEGVMEANASQNALLREQNALLRALLDKDVVASISTDSLVDSIARKNRRDGKTVIPVGV